VQQEFLDIAFDADAEEASPAFQLLPTGVYKAEILKAVAGPTKNSKGYAVTLTWSIVEGEYEHRVVFQQVLLQHESAEAEKFGRYKFEDVCDAIGVKGKVEDLTALYHRPCMIGIKIREDKTGQYSPRNEVGRVMPIPPHNGPTREMVKEAQKVPSAFRAVHADMNDEIPNW